jgi:hypothetical protein
VYLVIPAEIEVPEQCAGRADDERIIPNYFQSHKTIMKEAAQRIMQL